MTSSERWTRQMTDTYGMRLIRVERERQISKGYTVDHDDEHDQGEFLLAAVAHSAAAFGDLQLALRMFPIDWSFTLKAGRERNLVRAGALLWAERDRMIRAGNPDFGRFLDAAIELCANQINFWCQRGEEER